jgi:hypothetical protein
MTSHIIAIYIILSLNPWSNCYNPAHKPIVLHKIRVHANVDGNEQTNTLIKQRCKLDHRFATTPYEHALPTPYHLYIN